MKFKHLLPALFGFAALGAAAAAASTAPSFTAVVDSSGTLARGYRALHATRLGTGRYSVGFGRDVSACSYTASIGLPGTAGSETPSMVSVAPRTGKPKSLFVQTFTPDGTRQDHGFHVIVVC